MKIIYELKKEDLRSLGAMWANPTFVWRRLYSGLGVAQSAGNVDHGEAIEWKKKTHRWTSGDLRSVMYTIVEIEVID